MELIGADIHFLPCLCLLPHFPCTAKNVCVKVYSPKRSSLARLPRSDKDTDPTAADREPVAAEGVKFDPLNNEGKKLCGTGFGGKKKLDFFFKGTLL